MSKILVSGLHRSGTTHLGKLLSESGELSVLHEPANYSLGDGRVPCWYPSKSVIDAGGENFSRDILDPRKVKPRLVKRADGESYVKSCLRTIFGGEFEKSLKAAKSNSSGVLVKDPFLLRLASDYSACGYHVVVTVKHPLSNLHSVSYQGWSLNKDDFCEDIFGCEYRDFLLDVGGIFSPEQSDFLWLWFFLHRELKCSVFSGYLIWHQRFCERPLELRSLPLVEDFQLSKDKLEKLLVSTMMSSKIERNGELHQVTRNASAMSKAWRGSFTDLQVQFVEDYFGSIIHYFMSKSCI